MNLFLNTKSGERTTNNYVKYKFIKEIIVDSIGVLVVIAAIVSILFLLRDIKDFWGGF